MICWGSWGNTQKLASKNWRYELYYWDYTIGILLFALLLEILVFTAFRRRKKTLSDTVYGDCSLLG